MVRPPGQLIEKTIKRVSESKWTKLFVLTSILQAILVIVLEGRVYAHNNREKRFLELKPEECKVADSITRINNIMQENLVFMGFQAFQFLFCVNAIYNQNTIQMIAIAVINYVCALFGIVQIFETVKWRKTLTDTIDGLPMDKCNGKDGDGRPYRDLLNADIISFEVPLVAILLIFGTGLGFLAFKLYQQFGWNIYKRIGADLRKQSIYRTMLIFVMLLKLDIFFMLAFSILALVVLNINSETKIRRLNSGAFYFHLGLTILIVIMQFLAYISVEKNGEPEWLSSPSSVSLLTAIWSFLVLRNFNQGLKDLLDKGKHDENTNNTHNMENTRPTPPRWQIEDDDD
ncbi:5915_t:CDS:2 [Ambispora gerdemannii]|uniref:5915_t:CDS:1 n=1 Tax=Ambispora gerdemannii TaxID=144530 RepID=A0A9N9FDF6_9GLOM|nr:5915_t:CDS:2 [Ambispora gerdemannii]